MGDIISFDGDSDVGDLMLVTICDQKGQNGHQHLIVLTNTFRLQHPSPTSM